MSQTPRRRKASSPMSDYPDPTRTTGGSSADHTTVDEILAVIAVEEPRGATAAQVARALGLDPDVELVQDVLEELVERGVLDRLGIGHGATYTLNALA